MQPTPDIAAQDHGRSANGCAMCDVELCVFHPLLGTQIKHRARRLKRGDRLDCAGLNGCLQFWVMIRGMAATTTYFEDGRRQILGLETCGDTICGQMAEAGSQTWLEALTDCLICEVDLSPQAHNLRNDPAFMASTFGLIHTRLEQSLAHISTLGRLDSTERVTLFLAEMAERVGLRRGKEILVQLPMSREDIADYLGLNAETVSRILTRIKKSGLVRFQSPTEYIIPDMAALARRLPVAVPTHAPSGTIARRMEAAQ